MNNLSILIFGASLFMLSLFFVRVFCAFAKKNGWVAIPNARSSHQDPTPLGGGVVFSLLWALTLVVAHSFQFISSSELWVLLPATLLVSLCGFWDDYREISPKKRLLVQVLAAGFCISIVQDISTLRILSCTPLYLGWGGLLLAVVGIMWTTNIFNFMDGLDGIAAVEAIFVFGIGGLLFWLHGEQRMALFPWALVCIVAGFLVWNWPKARVFMGDVGSYCLGFLVGLFSVIGDVWYNIPLVLWVILFAAFWFDATVTLVRRFRWGEHLAMAHREHAFHRLHRAGYSSVQILFGFILINSILAAITLWTSFYPSMMKWGLLFAVVMLTTIYRVIEKIKPMERQEPMHAQQLGMHS